MSAAAVIPFPSLDAQMPQSPDAERAVLGSIVTNHRALDRVTPILAGGQAFFRDAHRTMYGVMLEMEKAGQRIDLLTFKAALSDSGVLDQCGGSAYVSSLVDVVPDTANVERYAEIVRKKAQMREVISIGAAAMQRGLADEGEEPYEIAAELADRLAQVRPVDANDALMSMDRIAPNLATLYAAGGVERGASTNWPSLDPYYTVARGAWTLVSGVPGHGKSGWLDNLAINLARRHEWQTVMFSAENFPQESHIASLIEKLVGLPFNDGPTARMGINDVERGLMFLNKHFRFIDPTAERMTLDRILAIASGLAEKRRVDALIIDPWNELHHEYPAGQTETQYISVQLTKVRRWVRKHNAHIFMVAHPQKMQKDRDTGKYGVPTPYDVSGGAHWRNKADYCICVYRDASDGDDDSQVAIYVQKVRRREIGKLGQVVLHYDKVTSEYRDPQKPRAWREQERD